MKVMNCCQRPLTACLLVLISGCGFDDYGKSEYELAQESKQDFIDMVQAAGGSAKKEMFQKYGQQGDAWAVDLGNAQIDDSLVETMCEICRREYIVKLNLSKSTITSAQLLTLNEAEVGNLMLELDLSNTAVDDATLNQLTTLNFLEQLKLTGSKVTSQGVAQFKSRLKSDPSVLPPFKNPKIEQ